MPFKPEKVLPFRVADGRVLDMPIRKRSYKIGFDPETGKNVSVYHKVCFHGKTLVEHCGACVFEAAKLEKA